jgi:hypothetical protein
MTRALAVYRSVLASFVALVVCSGPPRRRSAERAGSLDLPVTRVVLSTAGVGYFEHAGTDRRRRGARAARRSDQMDDLLQSLVLQDLDGGRVRPVRYGSRDPLGRILASYALDLSGNPSLAELLVQARGEPLTLRDGRRDPRGRS